MHFFHGPPAFLLTIAGFALAAWFGMAWLRLRNELERRELDSLLPRDAGSRFDRLEQAVDSIAVEVERISEAQRFAARLQAEQRLDVPRRHDDTSRLSGRVITPH